MQMPSSRSFQLVGSSVRTALRYTFQPRARGSLHSSALSRLMSWPPRRFNMARTKSSGWGFASRVQSGMRIGLGMVVRGEKTMA